MTGGNDNLNVAIDFISYNQYFHVLKRMIRSLIVTRKIQELSQK